MRKATRTSIAAGLALAATCAVADTYTYEETGYFGDENARVYTYVIYRTLDEETPIVTSDSTDVNAESRGSAPAVQPPLDEQPAFNEPRGAALDEPMPTETTKPTVAIGSRDVNEVKGRA